MSQLINDSLYISGSPSIQALYGTYTSKTEGVNAVKAGVYKNVPKGVRFGVVTSEGFEEYLYTGPVVARANVAESDFIKIFPIDEATQQSAGLMSSEDKTLLDQLIPVIQSGGWNVDSNYQVGTLTEGSQQETIIPEGLETRLTRIENILGDLYDDDDDTGASDGQITIEDDGVSNN